MIVLLVSAMSTYQLLSDLSGTVDAGEIKVKLSSSQTALRQLSSADAFIMPNLGIEAGLTNIDISASIVAEGSWTTVATGLLDGETLFWDRAGREISVASLNAADDDGSTGAEKVFIEYIDVAGDAQVFEATLNGTAEVICDDGSPIVAVAVNALTVTQTGGTTNRTQTNTGKVYCGVSSADASPGVWTAGKPDMIYSVIEAAYTVSRQAHFYVPNGVKFIATEVNSTNDATAKNDGARYRIVLGLTFGPTAVAARVVDVQGIGTFVYQAKGVPALSPGSVIMLEATAVLAGGVDTSIVFSGVLADTTIFPNA